MAKREQVLVLDPEEEITFKGDFTTKVCKATLNMTNPTDTALAFKVKTTAPKRYCVRPNSGKIAASESTSISIVLQPSATNDDLKKHKFMVQSVELSIDEERTVDEIFKGTPSSELMSKKLFCNFIREEEDDVMEENDTQAESPTQSELPQEVPTTGTFVEESPVYQENRNSSPEPEIIEPEKNYSEQNEEPISLITRPEIKAVPEEPKIIPQTQHTRAEPVKKVDNSKLELERMRARMKEIQDLNTKLTKEKRILETSNKNSSSQSEPPMDQSLMIKMMGIVCFIGIIIGWLLSNMFCRC